MATKYYHVDRANRKIRSQGFDWVPDTYAQACGCWLGLIAEPDEKRQAVLDELCKVQTNAITPISEPEYLKKKQKPIPSLTQPAPKPLQAAIVGPGVAAVESTESKPAAKDKPAPKIDDVFSVGPVMTASLNDK